MITLNSPLQPDIKKLTKYLEQVNQSGWYTNFGPLHEQLTERLEDFLGVDNLLLISNGTLALQVACKAINIESALTTPFSFVATTSSLLWRNMDVAFCDIDNSNLNLSPEAIQLALQRDKKYDAIVATHVYGNPCDVDSVERIAAQYQKKVVYDAAHAFGVNVKNKSVLSYGDASTLSFHATKIFHTVEGGAVIFKSRDDFDYAKEIINFGIRGNGSLGFPGINAKLNEYQSAVGLTLLDDIDVVLEYRARLFSLYRKLLYDVVDMPKWHSDANYNGSYMPILCKSENQLNRLMDYLTSKGIQSRKYFSPSLDLAYPSCHSFGCDISHKFSERILCLPLHFYLTPEDVKLVVKVVKEYMSNEYSL